MLNNISWQGYWTTLALTIVLYYSFVLLFFYKKGWLPALRDRAASLRTGNLSPMVPDPQLPLFQQPGERSALPNDAPEYVPAVRSLVDEIQAFFESDAFPQNSKPELIASLKKIARKHPGVTGTAYQHSVSNLIVFLAEQTSSIHLSAEEAGSVWT